ncbi:MAG: prolyl oligopeptidase family serine peptidase [Gemmataceae bacterium]
MKSLAFAILAFAIGASPLPAQTPAKYAPSQEELRAAYQRAGQFRPEGRAYKLTLTPHWFADGTRFWYRNDLQGGTKEFIVVDAEKGIRKPAFDHAKLTAGLSLAADHEFKADRLPFDDIEFRDNIKFAETTVWFRVGGVRWECDLESYECKKAWPKTEQPTAVSELIEAMVGSVESGPGEEPLPRPLPEAGRGDHLGLGFAPPELSRPSRLDPRAAMVAPPRFGEGTGEGFFDFTSLQPLAERPREVRAPDRKWTAFVREGNVFVRGDGADIPLSQDGKPGYAYEIFGWSPDSKALVAARVEPGDRKEVYTIESSPRGGGRAKLNTRQYPLPGDKFTAYELWVFDPAAKTATKVETERVDFGRPGLRWLKDGRHFTYWKTDRGHQRFRVIEVDSHTGKTRHIIDEKTDTFIWTAHREALDRAKLPIVTYLNDEGELLYASERDGWRHLYLIDAKAGKIKNQITRGEWVVRGLDVVDEQKRQIWFRASGKNSEQDPYFVHHYRVNFDGTELMALTEGNGTHTVQFSPDRKYLVDTWSRVDSPPVHELRRCADGKLVCELEKADISELRTAGWKPPEVFVSKGRDGKTDIWGIISRPANLDPAKKYPVVEYIYAGPHDSFLPKAFSPVSRFRALTELGFIVVQMDGMGTANRSKAFHDVCWHNLKDAGFPDRILWHQAVAKKYPYYDTSRVGIYGTSAGGQSSTGALLFHGDFYKAAVSACGCHDNRMDKASWNEQWMGYPVGPQYAECSNIDNAHRLRGKLLLIVGELDTNVPPESTFRLVDALIKAGKDFDLLVVPGMGHSDGGVYGRRRLQDFFVRQLHGVEPPDRNGAKQSAE